MKVAQTNFTLKKRILSMGTVTVANSFVKQYTSKRLTFG